MRTYIFTTLVIFAVLAALWTGNHHSAPVLYQSGPRRIVSLAPGITETLYALELDDRVAGVTSFCLWPPEAANKPHVGGFRDVNLEAIARTGADLVVLPEDMGHYRRLVENLGIPATTFDVRTFPGFLRDIQKLAEICGKHEKGAEIISAFRDSLKNIGKNAPSRRQPSVLFALMNPEECLRPITELTILGKDGFYDELIKAAGGRNAYIGDIPYPRLSREAILTLDPDVIVAAVPGCANIQTVKNSWDTLEYAKTGGAPKLLLLDDPGDTIPGPRTVSTLRKLAGTIAGWSRPENNQ